MKKTELKNGMLHYLVLSILLLALAVTGCGNQPDKAGNENGDPYSDKGSEPGNDSGSPSGTASGEETENPFVPVAEFKDMELPDAVEDMKCVEIDQNWLYLGARFYNKKTERGEMTVYRNGLFDAYGPEPYIIIPYEIGKNYKPYDLLAFVPDGKGGAFLYGQHDPLENADQFTLEKYDEDGALLWSIDYTGEALGEGICLTNGAAASDGSLYLYAVGEGGRVVFFGQDGNMKESCVPEFDSLQGVLTVGNGKAYGYGYVDGEQFFAALGGGASTRHASPLEFRKAFGGRGDCVCLCNRQGLWEYNPETDECHLLWNWDDEYIQMVGDSVEYLCYGDDTYYIMNRVQNAEADYMKPEWRYGQTVTMAAVSFRDRAEYPKREIITLARANSMSRYAFSSDSESRGSPTWTEDLVRMYNRQGRKYYVEIVDEEKGLKPSQKLYQVEMQILKGGGPDLLEVSGVYAPYMVENGMLEDLTKYYEASDAVSLEDLLPQIREGGSYNGMNVLATPAFYIRTWISKDPAPLKEWTPWKFLERCQESQMFYESGPYEMFGRCNRLNLFDQYVDYETKECHFDSPEFIRILEECKKVPSKKVKQNILEEAEYLAIEESIESMYDYVMQNEWYGQNCHQGMPGWDGAGHLMLMHDVFAMNTQSKTKEGAWDFLEFVLSKELQDSIRWAFPARTDSFEEYLKRSYQNVDYADERFIPLFAEFCANQVEEADFAALREMVASSVYVSGYSRDVVSKIVYEEASMFFSSDASLEQTIEKIQNRVSLYLKEM